MGELGGQITTQSILKHQWDYYTPSITVWSEKQEFGQK